MIESYYHQNIKITKIAEYLKRSRTPIYNVINFLKEGHTALEYYQQYKENKKRSRRAKHRLAKETTVLHQRKIAQGWTPDVIIERKRETNQLFRANPLPPVQGKGIR